MNLKPIIILKTQFSCKTYAFVFMMLSTLIIDASAQDKMVNSIIPVSIVWSQGSIMLNDGTEIKGLLKYNDKSGLLYYENGNDARSFNARGVVAFEFFDERLSKQRLFYSFPYGDPLVPSFFEVVKEYKSFAVLSKVDPIDIEHKQVSTPGNYNAYTGTLAHDRNVGTSVEISQTETIYFMNDAGDIKPYVQIVEKEIDGVFFDRSKTKNKMLNETLLQEHVGSAMHTKLVAYSKENKLSFKRKVDLVQILDHYSQLIK